MTKTAQDYRDMAKASRQRSRDSFDRCDTDGFLSQWCSDLSAREYDRKATILENDGKAEFCGLYEGERRVAAKLINGKFGTSWLLRDDEAERFGRRFIPTGYRSRIQKQLGLQECFENAPAWCKIGGEGTGLSGLSTAHVAVFRTGCKWGTDASIIETVATRAKREAW